MSPADVVLILILLAIMCFASWVSYTVGRGAAAREYQSALAIERGKVRRLLLDLDQARTENTHLRLRPGVRGVVRDV